MMKLLVINGPNLNMLGKRDADQYGTETLDQISHRMSAKAAELDVNLEFFQSIVELFRSTPAGICHHFDCGFLRCA